jgi:hypothetical protein
MISASDELNEKLDELSSEDRMEKAIRHFYDGYIRIIKLDICYAHLGAILMVLTIEDFELFGNWLTTQSGTISCGS